MGSVKKPKQGRGLIEVPFFVWVPTRILPWDMSNAVAKRLPVQGEVKGFADKTLLRGVMNSRPYGEQQLIVHRQGIHS